MITSLRLERFKNFRDATLGLGPFTVLIGANASGKSNIRDAFLFLHGIGRGYALAEILGEKYVGGERVWSGIRGGAREVAYCGSPSFQLALELRLGQEGKSDSLVKYRIETSAGELVEKAPSVLEESLEYPGVFGHRVGAPGKTGFKNAERGRSDRKDLNFSFFPQRGTKGGKSRCYPADARESSTRSPRTAMATAGRQGRCCALSSTS